MRNLTSVHGEPKSSRMLGKNKEQRDEEEFWPVNRARVSFSWSWSTILDLLEWRTYSSLANRFLT